MRWPLQVVPMTTPASFLAAGLLLLVLAAPMMMDWTDVLELWALDDRDECGQ